MRPRLAPRAWECRPGVVSLPELVLVAWLFGVILALVATFAASQGRLVRLQRDRARAQELVRTTRLVLDRELRSSLPIQRGGRGGDSIALRAVRGGGPVCEVDGKDVVVRYRGLRGPEPSKDSVLLLTAAAVVQAGPVRSASTTTACSGGIRLRLADELNDTTAAFALVYERGTYLIADGAFRYRRGAAGRQPLTEAVLADTCSLVVGPAGLRLSLAFDRDSIGRLPDRVWSVAIPVLDPGGGP